MYSTSRGGLSTFDVQVEAMTDGDAIAKAIDKAKAHLGIGGIEETTPGIWTMSVVLLPTPDSEPVAQAAKQRDVRALIKGGWDLPEAMRFVGMPIDIYPTDVKG
jgi:hypothetical protein